MHTPGPWYPGTEQDTTIGSPARVAALATGGETRVAVDPWMACVRGNSGENHSIKTAFKRPPNPEKA